MMKRSLAIWGVALLLVGSGWALPDEATAQAGPSAGAGPTDRLYNPQAEETVEGKVVSVDRAVPSRRGGTGVHLMLETAQGQLAIHLGPTWYFDRQSMRLAPGDTITVTGSRINPSTLIARRLTKGGETLILRDEAGRPVWAGGRARTP